VALIQSPEQIHLLVLSIHHIIADAQSLEILIGDLAVIYESLSRSRPCPLREPTFDYSDFSSWQKQLLQGPVRAQELAYWKQQLKGPLPTLTLPGDLSGNASDGPRGGRHKFVFPRDLAGAVKALVRSEGSTLFMALLTGFEILLHYYTDQNDLIVSSSISNRRMPETEDTVGLFLNTVLLRVDVRRKLTIHQLIARVRKVTLEAYAHQTLPFEEVVKSVLPRRWLSHSPVTPVVFGLHKERVPPDSIGGLKLSLLDIDFGIHKFDLELQMIDRGDELGGVIRYNTGLFSSARISEMADNFQKILGAATANPKDTVETVEQRLATGSSGGGPFAARPRRRDFGSYRNNAPMVISARSLVDERPMNDHTGFPLMIVPRSSEVNLCRWVADNPDHLESLLRSNGAVLFRGFRIANAGEFQQTASACCGELLEYTERSTPRARITDRVYTSTEYPSNQEIPPHNENSYSHAWPMKICFYCAQPAATGGETPLYDSRRVYRKIDPEVRHRFEQQKVMYTRNFSKGLGLSWEEAFQTDRRQDVEDYCTAHNIAYEWKSNGQLKTSQVRQGVATHPVTRYPVWFNQAHLFHIHGLETAVRESLLRVTAEPDFPRNAYFGDGSGIQAEMLDHVRRAYAEASFRFPWQREDLLLLDNMLVAHGRSAFTGSRKILVAMGDLTSGDMP